MPDSIPLKPSPDPECAGGTSPNDLNALLAEEQSSIMRAEAATEPNMRDQARDAARDARELIDLTAFPAREPHDFDALTPTRLRTSGFMVEFELLQRRVLEMERSLAIAYSEGRVGMKFNNFEHRSRLVRQARARLGELGSHGASGLRPASEPSLSLAGEIE